MRMIQTCFWNGISVCIRMLTLLGLNKILAMYVGPAGYATLGQFQNAIQMIMTVASGAFNSGVIRYTAEYADNPQQQHELWQTAGSLALLGAVMTSAVVILFNKSLAVLLFHNKSYGSLFVMLGIALILFVFNTLLLSILNGAKQIKRYVIANIAGSVLSFILTVPLVIGFGLYGALLSLSINQSLCFFATLWICHRTPGFKLRYLFGKIDSLVAHKLFKYTMMSVVSAVCVPGSQIIVRQYIGSKLGWEAAGYWEAMTRLSSAYLLLVTTTLSVYYLPRLSEIKERAQLKIEILQGYKTILPMSVILSLVLYIFRSPIISILFTHKFQAIQVLFPWQLCGDTLKILSWLLAYIYLAKGLTRLFIISEICFSIMFVVLVVVLENIFALQGVVMAYAINYFLYFCFVFISLKFVRIL